MNQWPSGQGNNMFPQGHMNPAALYNNPLGGPNQFDINQFTQGLPNGNTPSAAAASFPNQPFQPSSLVPAKRTHDGMSGSPVQNPASRSQTPNYAAFANQQAGQQFPNAPTPYAHLQPSNSNNATPSPTMQHQQFRPPSQQQQQPQQRMQNASPSPFLQQQQANYGNQMSPPPSQNPNMPQQTPMFNQQFGMAGANSMSTQMSNMNAQKAYQMKLMQQQQQLRNGMMQAQAGRNQQGPMLNAQQQQAQQQQMANGQAGGPMNMASSQQQQLAMKRQTFLKTLASHAQQQGRTFNYNPTINNKPVELFTLWQLVSAAGGSANVERHAQWQQIAVRLGFPEQQYPSAAAEIRQLYTVNIAQYERLWIAMRAQHKQDEARVHAQQLAGVGGPQQASPTRGMQQAGQQNAYPQFPPNQQNQMQPQSTPVQANAQFPPNGMVTPQQQQMMQHRRASSVQTRDQLTPQVGGPMIPAASPHSGETGDYSTLAAHPARRPIRRDEERSTEYVPGRNDLPDNRFGNYDMSSLPALGAEIAHLKPLVPRVEEMGTIDLKAITLSLASGIHAEVRYALDVLVELTSCDRLTFELPYTEDLLDIVIDCAEEQIEILSEDAAEVSDVLDLPSYEDVVRAARVEAEALQDVPEFGSHAFDLDRAAEKLIAITVILRNLTFWEQNHAALTSTTVIKWLSNTIRLLGTRNMLLRTFYNIQDFYKDMIIFLSNTTQSLELPSRDDALHILHFLLAFAPQPAPSFADGGGKFRFTSYNPFIHRYLPPAVDSLAKLLARQDPNRTYYNSIFTNSASSESSVDLFTRAFALAISVLPDRSKGAFTNNDKVRITEMRKAFMSQGMLAADILTTLAPSNDAELARAWLESEDGWAVGLVDLAAVLSVNNRPQVAGMPMPPGMKRPDIGYDYDSFRLIAQRALTMMKRLAEKAAKSSVGNGRRDGVVNGDARLANGDADGVEHGDGLKWEVIPPPHTVMGALLMERADKVALGLLCGLHEMVMKTGA